VETIVRLSTLSALAVVLAVAAITSPGMANARDVACIWEHLPAIKTNGMTQEFANGTARDPAYKISDEDMNAASQACYGAPADQFAMRDFGVEAMRHGIELLLSEHAGITPQMADAGWTNLDPELKSQLKASHDKPLLPLIEPVGTAAVHAMKLKEDTPSQVRQALVMYMAMRATLEVFSAQP
jgi:hypothetical protein